MAVVAGRSTESLDSTMRSVVEIVRDIETFAPVDGQWRLFEDLLTELWATGVREEHLPVLFRVFERYPEEDGAGVLWSILHGVEALPFDYEAPLRESVTRQPSHMGQVMLQRLEKSRAV
ncbi:MAG TPA: hypothetical protein VH040_09120 [Usitatibacter sp.]|jgi:hypothetical protein|nr:hypothetical protein [Usitatibacter sp.]